MGKYEFDKDMQKLLVVVCRRDVWPSFTDKTCIPILSIGGEENI